MRGRVVILLCLLLTLSVSCKRQVRPMVSGEIRDGVGEMLYLNQLTVKGIQQLDSVRLTSKGTFKFLLPESKYTELYELRAGKKKLILAVDSADVFDIHTTVDSLDMLTDLGDVESNIIAALRLSLRENDIEQHKQYAREVILQNPRSIVAYYALFQQQNGVFIFDPYNHSDRPYFQTVATAWNAYMPDNERTKVIYNLTLDAIKEIRAGENRRVLQQIIDESENAFLDIELPDADDVPRRLSEYRGSVILLDFSVTQIQQRAAYILELRELYNKYHKRGLQIYSVSGDANDVLWRQSVAELPWVNVRGSAGLGEDCFNKYNVQQLPTIFLFDKSGEVIRRFQSFDGISEAIEKII